MTDTRYRYRLDPRGVIWASEDDGYTWIWIDEEGATNSLESDELEDEHGPTVELVPATRVAELAQQLAESRDRHQHEWDRTTSALASVDHLGEKVDEALTLLRQLTAPPIAHNAPTSDIRPDGVAHNSNAPAVALTQAVLDRYQPAWSDGLVLRCRRCWNLLPQVRPLSALIAAAHVHATDECPDAHAPAAAATTGGEAQA